MTEEKTQDDIKIRGEFTSDPQVCKFVVNRPLSPEWTMTFNSIDDSLGSPLIDAVFTLDGVASVQVSEDALLVTKDVEEAWPKLASQMIPLVKKVLESDGELISAEALKRIQQMPAPDEMEKIITGLLDQYINPAIAAHGGFVKLIKLEDRDVYLEMGGGCQGCAASQATMKNGVEKAIRDALPQIREIIDVTDHTAGENPYYSN